MRVYKAIQEGVWPKYTLYVCVRPGVRPSVLPAHVCGPVCGHFCGQMVILVFLVPFYEDLQGEWMILERIFVFYA